MAILFATSTGGGATGAVALNQTTTYARDPAYTNTEFRLVSNYSQTNSAFLPAVAPSGSSVWFHMRDHPRYIASQVNALYLTIKDAAGTTIGTLNGGAGAGTESIRASVGSTHGTPFVMTGGTTMTFDVHVTSDGVTATIELYVDGALVSTASEARTTTAPTRFEFTQTFVAPYNTFSYTYVSELIISDESTLGMRLMELEPASGGTLASMDGDYTALLDATDANDLVSGTVGEKFSFVPVGYKGANSGETIAALVSETVFFTGTDGPRGATPFLYIGGAEYAGTPRALPPKSTIYARQEWALNPATAAAWTIADLATLEVGVQSDA